MKRSAILSGCGLYRYRLTRIWDPLFPKKILTWCLLNPSTADHWEDDPTVRRCIGFAKLWGYSGIAIVNLFAFRATNPKELRTALDPCGPGNVGILAGLGRRPLVVGWGSRLPRTPLTEKLVGIVKEQTFVRGAKAQCLGYTKGGEPKHPLMLPYSTERLRWPIERGGK